MSSPTKTKRLPAWAGNSIASHAQPIRIQTSKEISQQQQSASSHHQSGDVTKKSSSLNAADAAKSIGTGTKPTVQDFSKLMEGVTFTISGIVNPERTELRKMALDMGAQYRPSWSIDSTLLVCPFANTPTFKQVQASGGTIVHKDWLIHCYNQKELLAIEMYLLHVGKPWKTISTLDDSIAFGADTDNAGPQSCEDVQHKPVIKTNHESQTKIPQRKLSKQHSNPGGSRMEYEPNQRGGDLKNLASPVDVQQWVLEDLAATLTWLEQQNDKPKENELEAVAAQGLLVCLDDAIRSLQENKGLSLVMDNWAFIPRALKELAVYEKGGEAIKDQLIAEGERFKVIYESQLKKLGFGVPAALNFELRAEKKGKGDNDSILDSFKAGPTEEREKDVDDDATEILSDADSRDPADFDTDDTEELDEDEVTFCREKILHTFGLD